MSELPLFGREIVVHDLSEVQREIRNQVYAGDHLAYREVGNGRQGVRMKDLFLSATE